MTSDSIAIERQAMQADIVCVGVGPATGGFLTTLSRNLMREDGTPIVESRAMPGMPLQVICYERADDIAFGVSGVVTRARGIRATLPNLDPTEIPLATPVSHERVVYLLDPVGASRRSPALRLADRLIRTFRWALPYEAHAVSLPCIPAFLRKEGGFLLSIGQFTQWVGAQVMGSGLVQVWPGTPVAAPLLEGDRVVGVRLIDQGTDRVGNGYARIGEGSGSTNVLTGSGVDEAWTTGVQLAEGVIELLKEGKPFTQENLERASVKRRRESWVDAEARVAEKARDGFQRGVLTGRETPRLAPGRAASGRQSAGPPGYADHTVRLYESTKVRAGPRQRVAELSYCRTLVHSYAFEE